MFEKDFTFVHGDAGVWNFMVPRHGQRRLLAVLTRQRMFSQPIKLPYLRAAANVVAYTLSAP